MESEGGGATVVAEDGNEDVGEALRKQGWYLGEVTEDVATSILRQGTRSNTFAVYSSQDNATTTYTLSARFHVEGVEEGIIEHLHLLHTSQGRFQFQGQAGEYDDIVSAVNSYTNDRQPPLTPALGKSFQQQLSIPDEPPSYSQVDRSLAPDIAPLPDVATIRVDTAKEAETGNISPSRFTRRRREVMTERVRPAYLDNPHWYRYQDHCCLHPKNCYHCCFYRDTYWDGNSEAHSHGQFSLRGSGPLRTLGVVMFWIVVGPLWGCAYCVLCIFCLYVNSDND